MVELFMLWFIISLIGYNLDGKKDRIYFNHFIQDVKDIKDINTFSCKCLMFLLCLLLIIIYPGLKIIKYLSLFIEKSVGK